METVTLTGRGATGILGPKAVSAFLDRPIQVKLGRIAPKSVSKAPEFGKFFASGLYSPPAALDYYTKAMDSLDRMYMNDQLGCCVISGKAHNLGVYTAHDTDSGGTLLCSDSEIASEYRRICGPGDNGCNIDHVLRVMKTSGIMQGGSVRKIDGYVRVDWRDEKLVKAAIQYFGAVTVGFYLPNSWLNQDTWDLTNSRIVGGHDVSIVGWKSNGNYVVSSWGRLYEWTPRAFHSTQYIDEAYAILSPNWYNSDKIAPGMLSVEFLRQALEKIGSGDAPEPEPQPQPQPEPEPARPKVFNVQMTGSFPSGMWGRHETVTITGTATEALMFPSEHGLGYFEQFLAPMQNDFNQENAMSTNLMVGLKTGNEMEVAVPWDVLADVLGKVIPVVLSGIAAGKSAGEIINEVIAVIFSQKKAYGRERILTPEQWAKIFDFVLKLLPLLLA